MATNPHPNPNLCEDHRLGLGAEDLVRVRVRVRVRGGVGEL